MRRPEHPLALNLARVVQRLLLDPRGWRVDRMINELGIQPRTYRKYRALLQDHQELLIDERGRWRVAEVTEGEARYLRLVGDDGPAEARDGFLAQVAAFWMARKVFAFARDTELTASLDGAWADLRAAVRDRGFTFGHLLRDVDRMLYAVPDAPKSYAGQDEVLATLLQALFFSRRVRIRYRSLEPAAPRTHTLCPLTLVFWRSALYIVAAYTPDGRPYLFAIDRIESAERTADRFRYPRAQDYDPEDLFEGSFGIWQDPDGTPTEVVLRFAARPWLHRYLRERTWHPSQRFEPLDDGELRMRMTVTSCIEVIPWVRSFGDDVSVEGPPAVVEAVGLGRG